MSQFRLIILSSLCVLTHSLRCYDCTAPKNLFCYPFVKCEARWVECNPKIILNTEAFERKPPKKYNCVKLDYAHKPIMKEVDALKKCIGVKPDYDFCKATPLKPTDADVMPNCYTCNKDLCNFVSETHASLRFVAAFTFFCSIWWLFLL